VVTPPPNVRRQFLAWERPLLPQAVAFLAGAWSGTAPLDLARCLVVVPTRQAGRRLREALAEHAAVHGQAVFPPRVVTPELLVTQSAATGTATRLESLFAWTETLREMDLADFRAAFPLDPPTRDFAWALRLAKEFVRLQSTLAEGGLRLGDVATKAGDDLPEAERWLQLGELESLHAGQLAARGLRDAQAARIEGARVPPALRDFDRIVLLATPDPLPLALAVLAAYAGTVPVDVAVYASTQEADAFDGWGRPLAAIWEHRVLTLPEFAQRVHLCADPAAQARRITALTQKYPKPEAALSIGIADAELLPLLENTLARAGIAAFNPEGRARRHDRLYALLAALADFAAEPAFEAVAALLRCPDVLAWLGGLAGARFSPGGGLAELDELGAKHLPPTLAAAQAQAAEFPLVAPALAELAALRVTLTTGDFPANASAALMEIFSKRELDAAGSLAESAEVWMAGVREIGRALAADGATELTLTEAWQFALGAFADEVRTAERPAGAVDLLGWLELLWDDAPHLLVAGFNDGRVPSAVVGDAFLPEALREKLGLKRNAERFACDAYFLAALAASRDGPNGRLEMLFGKTSAAGDPLRPSRLLLRCPDEELPARVKHLFGPVEATKPSPPWARAWTLKPRMVAAPKRLSVTALRDWLACPFRFYLKHALKTERVELEKAELDARDFGTLLHVALQQLGESEALRDCTDAARLREFLLERFELAVRRRYGAELTLPLVVQFESARQRLRAAADIEAAERAAGWRTQRVEWKFEFSLGGMMVRGKIDRIDQHADGRTRVLDYKTGDKATEPVAAHLRSVRADEADRPAWLRYAEDEGKVRAWADLQLPLYRRAVAAEFGDAVACGYFNLPKAASETAITMWDGLTRDAQAAAERCAEGVVTAVTAGEFWPPRELSGREAEWDEFAEFFHHGAAASVAWEGTA
jgi:ATP-dependent helicase/nuclease subunit B